MPHAHARSTFFAAVSVLLLSAAFGGSVTAADDPEAAVEALFDAVAARELDDLDGLVCAGAQDDVRQAFGDAALGLDLMALSFGSIVVSVEDRAIEITAAEDDSATARVTATVAIDVEEAQLRAFAREIIEASADPGDPPVTDEDIELMLPLMVEALALEQPLESEISVALEDGEWVVCTGFATAPEEAVDGFEPGGAVSTEGLCALATPAELSTLGPLEYDASTGFEEFCTYSQSDWDAYHDATVSLAFDTSLDDWRELYPADEELEIADAPAFSSGPSVFTEAGEDVLQVSVSLPREAMPDDEEAPAQAARISQLFLPRLGDLVLLEMEPTPEPTTGRSLCDGLSLAELNGIAGDGFDSAEGDPWVCTWSSSDPATGLGTISATLTDLTLDEFRELVGQTSEGEIEGMPALFTSTQAIVELPDGRTLDVSVYYDERMDPALSANELALRMAEWLAPDVAASP